MALTASGAEIQVEGLTSPAGSEVGIRVQSASDASQVKYVYQKKSDSHGMVSFRFSTEGFAPDTYEVIVNVAGARQPKKKYFRIAPPQVPVGAHDVFDCFTINGHPVQFDDSKYAFVEMDSAERDTVPVFDISTVDKSAAVTMTPATAPKIPCAVKVSVSFADGTKKVYSLVLDEISDKRITNFTKADKAGPCMIEENVKLGTGTEDASLVYSDRDNVFWRNTSSPIFSGATQIRRSKSDAGGFTNDNTTIAGASKISTRPYYAGPYSGQNGEGYWMTFQVHADATVYMADGHGQGWPNNDGTWKNDSPYIVANGSGGASASGKNLYYKKVKAGDTVQIPNYGKPANWPEDGVQVYDPPVFAVVWASNGTVEGTDASLNAISYRIDGGEAVALADFRPDLDAYTIQVNRQAANITFAVQKSEEGATVSPDAAVTVPLSGKETKKEIRVVSEGGIVEKTYTILIKKNMGDAFYGDVDGDGGATSSDAMWILRSELGITLPQGLDMSVADVDGDGEATSSDAMWILRYELGMLLPPDITIGKVQ